MPLDIKPLSPGRRAAMVLVLALLLGLSLAFAEILVSSRTAANPEGKIDHIVLWSGPPGFTQPAPFFENIPGCVASGSGMFGTRPRHVGVFSYSTDASVSGKSLQDESLKFLTLMVGDTLEADPGFNTGYLGKNVAVNIEAAYTPMGEPMFMLQRLTILPGTFGVARGAAPIHNQIVAICYSGQGQLPMAIDSFSKFSAAPI